MRKLYIYTGITPNQDNGRHYMFNDVTLYMAELQQHLLTTIDLNNYIINTNVAKIGLSNLITADNYDKVTYLIDYDEVTGYFKCYTVLRADLQDYVVYMLEVDLWATFIKDASFSKVHVTRCNRRISNYGIYDEPQSTEALYELIPAEPTNNAWLTDKYTSKNDEVYFVVLIQYNMSQETFNDDAITTTKLYAIKLSYLETVIPLIANNILQAYLQIFGGIYEINGRDAQVIGAYVLPSPLLDVSLTESVTAKSKFIVLGTEAEANIPIYAVNPSRSFLQFNDLPTDPNKVYYFGTVNGGLKLKKYTKATDKLSASIHCFVGATDIKVIVMQGEEQQDITDNFAIELTTSASVTTSIRRFAKIMGGALKAGESIVKDVVKGNYVGAGLSGADAILSQVNQTPRLNKSVGSGDAYFVYYKATGNTVQNPFYVTAYESVNSGEKHARMFGATFDYYGIDGVATTTFNLTSELIGTGNINDTYIVASTDIDGIPLEAHNEIGRKLSTGIYYKLLTQ